MDANYQQFYCPHPILNTTSKLNPLYVDIISVVKIQHRSFQKEVSLDAIDENFQNIYRVDILSSMHTVNNIWSDKDAECFINSCFHISIEADGCPVILNISGEYERRVQDDMNVFLQPPEGISIVALFNMPVDSEHCQVIFEEGLVDQVGYDSVKDSYHGDEGLHQSQIHRALMYWIPLYLSSAQR